MSQANLLYIDFMFVDKDDKKHHHNDHAIGDHWWDHKHYKLFVSNGHQHKKIKMIF
jgi:hypothetical protein